MKNLKVLKVKSIFPLIDTEFFNINDFKIIDKQLNRNGTYLSHSMAWCEYNDLCFSFNPKLFLEKLEILTYKENVLMEKEFEAATMFLHKNILQDHFEKKVKLEYSRRSKRKYKFEGFKIRRSIVKCS